MTRHGTLNGYVNDGCRKECCRAAHAANARRRRRLKAYGRAVPKSIPITGTLRRIRALACLGWSLQMLSVQLGWTPSRLHQITTQTQVSPRNAERIGQLYDRLWDTPAPRTTRWERMWATRSANAAVLNKWAPPMAWDDDTIDIPESVPLHEVRGEDRRFADRDRIEQVAELTRAGLSCAEIAIRVGTSARNVQRDRARAREEAAA